MKDSTYCRPGTVRITCVMALSLPASSSTAR
jgi:hypothetical protein